MLPFVAELAAAGLVVAELVADSVAGAALAAAK